MNHLVKQSEKLIPAFRVASGLAPMAVKQSIAGILLNKAMSNAREAMG